LHCSLELSMLVLALKFSKGGRDQARVYGVPAIRGHARTRGAVSRADIAPA